jgi:hypothetical protein
MRPSLLVAVLVLLGGGLAAGEPPRLDLSRYLGKDLRDFEKSHAELRRLIDEAKAAGVRLGNNTAAAYPWFVARFDRGRTAHLLFEGYEGPNVPDVSYAVVHRLAKDWSYLGRSRILTGYRMLLSEAAVVASKVLGQPLLRVKTTCQGPFLIRAGKKAPLFERGAYQLQYYAIHDSRIALVRLEDERGRIVRNRYSTRVPFKGPDVNGRAAKEWRRAIRSPRDACVLEALVWLTGEHLDSGFEREPNVNRQSVESSRTFESVSRDPETRKIVVALTSHRNPWIREYAKLFLKPPERARG